MFSVHFQCSQHSTQMVFSSTKTFWLPQWAVLALNGMYSSLFLCYIYVQIMIPYPIINPLVVTVQILSHIAPYVMP